MKKFTLVLLALLMVSFSSYAANTCPEPGTPGWITSGKSTYVLNNGNTVGVGTAYYDGENDYLAESNAIEMAKNELKNRIFDATYKTLKNSFVAMPVKDRVRLTREITNNMTASIEWKGLTHDAHLVNCNDLYVKLELPMNEYAYRLENLIEMAISDYNGNNFDCWEQEKIAFELKRHFYIVDCVAS